MAYQVRASEALGKSIVRGWPIKFVHQRPLKVLPWVVDGAGGLGAGKTSGAGMRGVSLNAAIGGRTGYSDTNGGESSNN